MNDRMSEHHIKNVGERETHRVHPDHHERFRSPERLEKLRPEELVKVLSLSKGEHVLDLGCGDGVFFEPLSEAVGAEGKVSGVDIEPGMVEAARKTVTSKNLPSVEVKQSENDRIPLGDATVDAALVINTLHEMAYPGATLEELNRVVTPSGRVLLLDRHKEETGEDGPPIQHLMSREEALEQFRTAGFEVKREVDWIPEMYSFLFEKVSERDQ